MDTYCRPKHDGSVGMARKMRNTSELAVDGEDMKSLIEICLRKGGRCKLVERR